MHKLIPCLNKNHVVFILENLNTWNDRNLNITISSINFAAWRETTDDSYHVSYLNENLNLNHSYKTVKDVDFSNIISSKEIPIVDKAKCSCVGGQVKIRIGYYFF